MVEKSKNQFSSNIIALSNFNKALDNALDKATVKHTSKQLYSTGESTSSIDKQLTINKEEYYPIQKEVLNAFDFSDAEHHYPHRKLVNEFFNAKIATGEIDIFIDQFRSYKKYINEGDNIKFRFSLGNFLGNQKQKFEDGKWLSENWSEKIKSITPAKQSHSMFGASN